MTKLSTRVPNASVNPGAVRKAAIHKAINQNQDPAVPDAGGRTYPRNTAGQQVSSSTGNQTPNGGTDLDGQAQHPGAWSNTDTEAAAGRQAGWNTLPPGTTRGGAAYWPPTVRSDLAAMVAEQLLNNTSVVNLGDGATVAIPPAEAPGVQPQAFNLNPSQFQEMSNKVTDLTRAFRETAGRYPQAGTDEAFWEARSAIVAACFGPAAGKTPPGTNVQS